MEQQTLIKYAEKIQIFHAGTQNENTGSGDSVSVRFTPSQKIALEKLAQDRNESRAEYIRKFFEDFIDFEPFRGELGTLLSLCKLLNSEQYRELFLTLTKSLK